MFDTHAHTRKWQQTQQAYVQFGLHKKIDKEKADKIYKKKEDREGEQTRLEKGL